MLDRDTSEKVKSALSALSSGEAGAGAWDALPVLSDLCEAGLDLQIDLRASEQIGAPIVIVRQAEAGTGAAISPRLNTLTRRQHQVALCLARGLSNKQIAAELGIRVTTTKDHVHAVLTKLDVESRGKVAALMYSKEK